MALGIFKWEMVWHNCKLLTAVMRDACAACARQTTVRATWQLDISRREQRQAATRLEVPRGFAVRIRQVK